MNEKIHAEIKKVDKVLENELGIPDYQRPYRWTKENVHQLLKDVYESWKSGKSTYRIGSIILHSENQKEFQIVDGQQRITTILLILKALDDKLQNNLTDKLKYNHVDSRNAIINNKQFIDRWLTENINSEKNEFYKYLFYYCEFVEINVEDLSEAFQMFDSQNGRGKELEAYNLLKAYHIRAMESNSFDEKIECDRNWESATRHNINGDKENNIDLLKQLFNEQIYRTRIWSRKEEALPFDKKKISEFKGVSINKHKNQILPFQNKELLNYIVQNYFNSIGVDIKGIKHRFEYNNFENINPFVLINQNIINGKHFFEYIETYVEIYKQLFIDKDNTIQLSEFKIFFREYCLNYRGAHRDGDRYLLEVYKSLLFIIFDKFGEDGVNKYYKILYSVVYRFRLEKMQVKYAAVAAFPAEKKFFYIIERAKSYIELQLEDIAFGEIECRKRIDKVLEFYANYAAHVSINENGQAIDLGVYRTNGSN